MKALIIDTETTGLDISNDKTIEVAGLLLSTTSKETLAEFAFLLKPGVTNNAYHINKISDAAFLDVPDSPMWSDTALAWATYLIRQADVLISHNAEFDQPRLDLLGLMSYKPHLCTRRDLHIPGTKAGKLSHMAVDLGIPVLSLHRAGTDVRILAQILCTVSNLDDFLREGMGPKLLVKANVSFDTKDLAKNEGFIFHHATKTWRKKITESEYLEWQKPFGIQVIEEK